MLNQAVLIIMWECLVSLRDVSCRDDDDVWSVQEMDFLTISICQCLCVRSSVSCYSNVYLRSKNSPVLCCETVPQLL